MKIFFALALFFTTSLAQAESPTSGWKWGLGFDTNANIKSAFTLDLAAPQLFGTENEYTFLLSISSQRLNTTALINDDSLGQMPVRLMFEMRNPVYKDLVSSYFRIGIGWVFATNTIIHKDKDYFIIPFAFGADIFTMERNGNFGSVFVQASQDSNFSSTSDGLVDNLDGTTVSVGFRIFY